MDNSALWMVFLAVGLGTFLLRVSFIELHATLGAHLDRIKPVLLLLPAAILAALCMPAIVFSKQGSEYSLAPSQWLAALCCILVAKLTHNVFWPILAGMLCLWLTRWAL